MQCFFSKHYIIVRLDEEEHLVEIENLILSTTAFVNKNTEIRFSNAHLQQISIVPSKYLPLTYLWMTSTMKDMKSPNEK